MSQSEIQIQSAAFQWAWNTFPQTRLLLFHVPNGGSRSKVEATQLKAAGVIAGVPDMLFILKGRIHAFEFKKPGGRLSPEQVKVHEAWLRQGVTVHIVTSVEQFKYLFNSILSK